MMKNLVFVLLATTGCADNLEPYQQRDMQVYFEQSARAVPGDDKDAEGDGLCLCFLYEHGILIATALKPVSSGALCPAFNWHNPPYRQDCS